MNLNNFGSFAVISNKFGLIGINSNILVLIRITCLNDNKNNKLSSLSEFIRIYPNLFEFIRIYLNLFEFIRIYPNLFGFI